MVSAGVPTWLGLGSGLGLGLGLGLGFGLGLGLGLRLGLGLGLDEVGTVRPDQDVGAADGRCHRDEAWREALRRTGDAQLVRVRGGGFGHPV